MTVDDCDYAGIRVWMIAGSGVRASVSKGSDHGSRPMTGILNSEARTLPKCGHPVSMTRSPSLGGLHDTVVPHLP